MRLFLVKNGIPYDVAMSLSNEKALAFVVVFQEMEGLRFNWQTMSFEEPKHAPSKP